MELGEGAQAGIRPKLRWHLGPPVPTGAALLAPPSTLAVPINRVSDDEVWVQDQPPGERQQGLGGSGMGQGGHSDFLLRATRGGRPAEGQAEVGEGVAEG